MLNGLLERIAPPRHIMSALLLASALAVPTVALAQQKPQYGGKLTMNVHDDAPNLNPLGSTSFAVHSRLGLALSRLIEWKTGPDVGFGEFVAQPALAESWTISPDGLTYTFALRKDVVWQDVAPVSGRPFVAADVLATYKAIQEGGVQKDMLASVKSITAPDDHTIVMTLHHPNVVLPQNLANENMWILPQEAFNGGYDRKTKVIGTGPFILVKDEPGVATRYVRNPTYFGRSESGDKLPYLDAFDILPIKDLNARITAFRGGQIDIWYGPLNIRQMEGVQQAVPTLQVQKTVSGNQTEFYLNPSFKPFSDIRVRQAVNMSIDRLALGDVVRGGGGIGGVVGPAASSQTLPEKERIELYGKPDQKKAKALLAEAGYPQGFSFEMTVLNFGEEFVREAEWIQQDLAEIGVKANIKMLDTAAGKAAAEKGGFEGLFLIMSPFSEADEYFTTHYLPGGNRNYTNIDDPALTAMIKEQEGIVDKTARQQKIFEIQRYIAKNIQNPLPIWAAVLLHPSHKHVRDWRPMLTQGFPSLNKVWIAK